MVNMFSFYVTAITAKMLEDALKKIGLEINSERTKIMELVENGEEPSELEDST